MSAAHQLRPWKKDESSPADAEARPAANHPEPEDPLQLLRDAIERLKSSNGKLPDQAQVAGLLAEAREALERANAIARAIAQCEAFLKDSQFEKAFEALDACLLVYPGDPTLLERRREAEEQKRALESAAAVRSAIEEAQWLFDQDRVDLAIQFLRSKAAELPAEPALLSGLEELEALLPQWEQKRHVHAALERAVALEQLEQGHAALTVLEEALQAYPSCEELIGAAKCVRERLVDRERRKKLTRRLELIGEKIDARSWREAAILLRDTQREFPDTPELRHLQSEVDAGLISSEQEAISTEVRRYLADGEIEQAEQVLLRGLESFGPEPAFELLRDELEAHRKYREALRAAQILFARWRLEEAERVLTQISAQDRPEARTLLNAVKAARAAAEEENFCERGREKALKLMQEGQFAQASDLLQNLLSLFPGNPILERDLTAARRGLSLIADEVPPAIEEESREPSPAPPEAPQGTPPIAAAAEPQALVNTPSRSRQVIIAGACSLVLASAAGTAWKLLHNAAPVPVPVPVAQPPAETAPPAPQNPPVSGAPTTDGTPQEHREKPVPRPAQTDARPASDEKGPRQSSSASAVRPFVPVQTKKREVPGQAAPLPAPPSAAPVVPAPAVTAEVIRMVNTPAPPPAAPRAASPSPSAPAPAAPVATGGRFQEAQLVHRVLPDYPSVARELRASGRVRLYAVIDEHGNVNNVKVLSGQPMLAGAARNAVLQWKYKPATLNGQPIATNITIEISFGNENR